MAIKSETVRTLVILGLAAIFTAALKPVLHAAPVYSWTRIIGGVYSDWGSYVAVDPKGNIYVTGETAGTVDFDDSKTGEDKHTARGRSDAFLTKFNPDGSYGWTKLSGGASSSTRGVSIATDRGGNVYLLGFFDNTVDFDPGPKEKNLSSPGAASAFLTRINSDGSYAWTWATGSRSLPSECASRVVTADAEGNLYVTGYFTGTIDFDPGPKIDERSSQGGKFNIFLTRISSDGAYGWTKVFSGIEFGSYLYSSVAADPAGNVYVAGEFSMTVNPAPVEGVDILSAKGWHDAFVIRINSDGSYAWTKTMGGTEARTTAFSVTVDPKANIYVTGAFYGTVDFDPGPGVDNHSSTGQKDVFLTRMNSDGSYAWTKTMPGDSFASGNAVTTDVSGNVYMTGNFNGTVDFNPGPEADKKTAEGTYSIFITRINSDGSYAWTKTMGGSKAGGFGRSIVIDSANNVHVSGEFTETIDFDPEQGVDKRLSAGKYDVFVIKFAQP